jgi:hypothetical protein
MSYKDMARRLAEMEAADQHRLFRVYSRVLDALPADERACFVAFLKRDRDEQGTQATSDEWPAVCHVEHLVQRDREMRPGDLMGIPADWMEAHGYGAHL